MEAQGPKERYREPGRRLGRAETCGGQTLIGTLVVLVIIMLGYLLFLNPRKMKNGTVKSAPKAAMDKATDMECSNYLGQVRQALSMYGSGTDENERPANLSDLGKSMEQITKCPVGGEPYQYDPTTGKVWCTHPGHEKY